MFDPRPGCVASVASVASVACGGDYNNNVFIKYARLRRATHAGRD